MAKDFKAWLDDFVEKGANPNDVTEWPEGSGGGEGTITGLVIPQSAYVTVDCDKIKDLLASKGFDIDVTSRFQDLDYGVGIYMQGVNLLDYEGAYPPLHIGLYNDSDVAKAEISGFYDIVSEDIDGAEDEASIGDILTTLGVVTLHNIGTYDMFLFPELSARAGSNDEFNRYELTLDEVKTFISISDTDPDAAEAPVGPKPLLP